MKILTARGLYGKHVGGAEMEVADIIKICHGRLDTAFVVVTNSEKLAQLVDNQVEVRLMPNWPVRESGLYQYLKGLFVLKNGLMNIVEQTKPEILLAQSREDYIALSYVAHHLDIPLVMRDHGDLREYLRPHGSSPLRWAFRRFFIHRLNKANLIFVHTKNEANFVEKFVSARCVPMPAGIVMDTQLEKSIVSVRRRVKKISVVSRLDHKKGISCFLKAVTLLTPTFIREVEIEIIGDGEMKEQFIDEAETLGLSKSIFKGRVDNRDQIYDGVDILVLPSEQEGWGRNLSEGMYFGLPIIASDIPSYKEQLGDNAGILFQTNNHHDLARKIHDLADDYTKRKSIAANAYSRVRKIADIQKVVNTIYLPELFKLREAFNL